MFIKKVERYEKSICRAFIRIVYLCMEVYTIGFLSTRFGIHSNMNTSYFCIAGHTLAIHLRGGWSIESLLPEFLPFAIDPAKDTPILFSLTLSSEIPVCDIPFGEEVVRFDWEDARCTINRTEGNHEIQITPAKTKRTHRMCTNSDFSCATVYLNEDDNAASFILNNFLMMLYAFSGATHATLMLHASVVTKDGRGYLFLGKSGTGKSTHSRLWVKHIEDADLLNDDNPIVRLYPNRKVMVYGSPWSGKTHCYKNEGASVGAFVRLKQAQENRIRREKTVNAFASLLPSCSCLKQDRNIFDPVCDSIGRIVSSIPVYYLECLPNEEAALLCYNSIHRP